MSPDLQESEKCDIKLVECIDPFPPKKTLQNRQTYGNLKDNDNFFGTVRISHRVFLSSDLNKHNGLSQEVPTTDEAYCSGKSLLAILENTKNRRCYY